MRNRMLISILLATVMSVAACAEEGGDVATPAPTPLPTTGSPSPGPSPTGSPSPAPGTDLGDGRHFGYIESVDIRPLPGTMVFDLAYFLTGDEANEAAEEHGDETPVPNDYYIVNDNPRLRTLVVSRDIRILLIDWKNCCDRFSADPGRFQDSFALDEYPPGNYKGKFSQYWLTVKGGVVSAIEEQYLP
ncbi:MAG: hypothetical protein ACRDH0_05510 [Actinomycetota bacterium]